MTVVINDFEVMSPAPHGTEQPKAPGAADPHGDSEEVTKAVELHLRTRRERAERLHAS